MSESIFTVRVNEDLKNEFISLAKSQDRTAAQLVRDFMRDYIANHDKSYDEWFRQQVLLGKNAVVNGELISNEEVTNRFQAKKRELCK